MSGAGGLFPVCDKLSPGLVFAGQVRILSRAFSPTRDFPMNAKKLLILAACMGLAACGGVDPNSPLGKRQAIFKEMLHTSEDLGGMLRGRINFDEQRFATGATKLDQLSRQPWQHFPQAQEGDSDSAARDEVWQRQERFQVLVRELEASTGQLAGAVKSRPFTSQTMAPLVQKVEDGCEACHQEFRAY